MAVIPAYVLKGIIQTLGNMSITTGTTIITAFVAVIVAIITLNQWRTNRARLRHELFDRRYAVYEQIAAFIATILTLGKVPQREPEGFLRSTKTAYFVFACDNDIKVLITEIDEKAKNLHALEAVFDFLSEKDQERNLKEQQTVKEWLRHTLNSLEKRFEKYLKLSN